MSKSRFGFIAGWLVIAFIGTGFLPPKYSFVWLVPWIIVGSLAYAFFKYEQASEDARTQVASILLVFFIFAYYHIESDRRERQFMRETLIECDNHPQVMETQPFIKTCKRARSWESSRREPRLGRLW